MHIKQEINVHDLRLLKKFYTGATSVRCEVGWNKIKWFIYLCEGLKGPIFEPCSVLLRNVDKLDIR